MALNDMVRPLDQTIEVRKAINGNAGADVTVDLTGPDTQGRVAVPCAEIRISSAGALAIRMATKAGEIAAGRYKVIPASGVLLSRNRNGIFFFRGDTAGADTVEVQAR